MPDGACALSSLHRTCRPGKRSATGHGSPVRLRAYPIRAILLAILDLGSAQNPHVLRVRSGFCALSVSKLAAPITPGGIGSYSINFNNGDRHNNIPYNRISQVFRPRNFSSCATL
ncbi:hypothetical protein CCO45_15220 [Salmonella enterica subsp. enterica serovar Ealing]|nr:hypothetical protein CCO45_15220 [Salmonella enterica subsp. enterica serovar Ealing]